MINHKIYQGGNYELKNELHSVPRNQQKDFSRHIEFAVFTTDRDKENFNTFSNKFGQMYTQIIRLQQTNILKIM